MRKFLLFIVIVTANYSLIFGQTQSQTKTANLFNWNGNPYLNLWAREGAQYVSSDDNSYAYSKKLSPHRGALMLVLQDFAFSIPSDAGIQNIIVTVRRFKKGSGAIKDYFANLLIIGSGFYNPSPYGVKWTNTNNYQDSETEILYTQTGSGTNGGAQGSQSYQWTPALINDPAFGVRIDTYEPQGGSVVVYYDLVTITVEYISGAVTQRSQRTLETKPAAESQVYPNPFTTNTTIQFRALESGNAVVELYNSSGEKVRTLFSGVVIQNHVYYLVAGDAQLPKGVFIYRIINGRQKQTGRIIKLD